MDEQGGRPPGRTGVDTGQGEDRPGLLTLTEAAARSGHSREALRQRVRRGTLRAIRGNDKQYRIDIRDLDDLPPPEPASPDDPGQVPDDALDSLAGTVADLRAELTAARIALDAMQAERLTDRGRAERAESQAAGEERRADAAEARANRAETALAEARTPYLIRVIRAFRGG